MVRTVTLIVVVLLIGLFALVNWTAFSTPTTLSLLVTEVHAPLGLVMLGLVVVLALLFTFWAITMQATMLVEQRRQGRELQAQRELADKAEASRFVELRGHLDSEMARAAASQQQGHDELLSRLTHVEGALRLALEQNANSVAASIGEFEDRLERGVATPPLSGGLGVPPVRR